MDRRRASARRAGGRTGRRASSRSASPPCSRCSWSPAIAAVASGGDVDAGRTLGRARSDGRSSAPRACPSPAATTLWSPPTAGRWRALSAPWHRPRSPSAAPPACPWSRSTSAAAGSESCAVAADPHLTAAGRRTTAFISIEDRRQDLGWVEVTYWLYRPGLGWERDRPPRDAGRCRRRRRHPGPAQGRPRPGPAGDPPRPRPLRLPGQRAPAVAVERPRHPWGLVELSSTLESLFTSPWCKRRLVASRARRGNGAQRSKSRWPNLSAGLP